MTTPTSPTPTGSGSDAPTTSRCASETIGPIVELIEQLIESGHAYAADGDVYFSVRSYPQYGELSHRDVDQMDQGEGVEGAERKRDPLDFALWKAHKPGEDSAWDAPWGPGRPGWHIECSAMAEQLLGLEFEIHGGGSDLIFPHHENEAAQTFAARGEPLATAVGAQRHGPARPREDVQVGRQRRSCCTRRSTRYGRDALLMYFCGAHYRQPMEFDDERLAEAQARVREDPRGRPRPHSRRPPRLVDAAAGALLRRAGQRLQHAARAGGAVRLGPGGQPHRSARRRR